VIVTKRSRWSVAETIERLERTIAAKGLKLFAVIDHSGEAEAHGLELRDTKVVIFGSPEAGTPVMQARPLAALDLARRRSWSGSTAARRNSPTPPPRSSRRATASRTSSLQGSLASTLLRTRRR
jgi:hypothetical protein